MNATPPQSVWNSIASNLDAAAAERRKKRTFLLLPLLLVLSVGSAWFIFSPKGKKHIANSEIISEITPVTFETEKIKSSTLTNSKSISKKLTEVEIKNVISIDKAIKPKENVTPHLVAKNETAIQINQTKTDIKSLHLYLHSKEYEKLIYTHPFEIKTPSIKSEFPKEKEHKYWIGVGYNFSDTKLLNGTFYEGLSATSLVTLNKNYYHNFSIDAGINISEKWSLSTVFAVNNSMGQSYSTYQEGKYVTNDLRFKQSGILLSARRNIGNLTYFLRRKSPVYVSAGLYVMNTSKVKLTQNRAKTTNISNEYKTSDFGLVFSTGLNMKLSDKLSLNPHIRTTIGATNLFKGNEMMPSDFNVTRSLSISPGISLQYNF